MRAVLSAAKPKSSGRAGEEMAPYAFKRLGWTMFKVPPDVKVCGRTNRSGVFQAVFRGGGMPDFVGYYEGCDKFALNNFRACEIKEATAAEDERVPHSRLSSKQREFMSGLPERTAYVGILWRDGTFEIFPFSSGRGSYRKSEGMR